MDRDRFKQTIFGRQYFGISKTDSTITCKRLQGFTSFLLAKKPKTLRPIS